MNQNRSSAVMQQRSEPHDSLDDFPTPPWAVRALVEHVIWPSLNVYDPKSYCKSLQNVWEPACNRGFLARPLKEYFGRVHSSDIHDYSEEWGGQERVTDFLYRGSEPPHFERNGIDWIITNPPFRLAQQFFERAADLRARNVALLVRSAFIEGVGRYEALFKRTPPSIFAQFSERVPMVKGRCDPDVSSATAYCWLVWLEGEEGCRLQWIPPCRRRLERADDYEIPEIAA